MLIVTEPRPFTGTSCCVNPTELNTNTSEPAALMEKFPASFVTVAVDLPLTCTVTPDTALPVASVTVPDTVCEEAATEKNKNNDNDKSSLLKAGEATSFNFLLIKASRFKNEFGFSIERLAFTLMYKVSDLKSKKLPIKASDEFYTSVIAFYF